MSREKNEKEASEDDYQAAREAVGVEDNRLQDLLHEMEFADEVDTEDEELFAEIADDIADEMYAGCDDGTEMALRKFREVFGADKVTFKEDGSGAVEYEAY